jgi:IrrE N-terminal-like domain
MINPLEFFAIKAGKSSPEEAMASLCKTTREKASERTVPVGLRSILSLLDVAHVYENGTGAAASISVKGPKIIIKSRKFSESSWRRHRFSIAHEIGHVLLMKSLVNDQNAYAALRNKENWKQIELLCHFAASEILIPSEDFTDQIKNQVISKKLMLDLYDRYLVSFEVILQKFLKTDFQILIFWKNAVYKGKKTWFVSKAYWNGDYFVPLRLTSKNHMFPDVFNYTAVYDDALLIKDLEIKFGNVEYVGSAVTMLYPKKSDEPRYQPKFEGFEVPDDLSSRFDAFTLYKVNFTRLIKPKKEKKES